MKNLFAFISLVLATQFIGVKVSYGQLPWKVLELVPGGRFDAIADLGDGQVVVGTREPTPGLLFKSNDYGQTWKKLGDITSASDAIGKNGITCLVPGKNGLVYMLTTNAEFWRSTDYGESWEKVKQLSSELGEWAYSYGLWVTRQGTVLATTGNMVYRSSDDGQTFQQVGPISEKPVYRFTTVGDGILLNGWAGQVFKSSDDGKTWQKLTDLDHMPLYATEYLGASTYIQGAESGSVYLGDRNIPEKKRKVATLNGGADDFVYLGYNTIIYSTYTDQKNVYFSVDGGNEWVNTGKIPTGAEGDWLDHVIKLERPDSVIAIGGTNKGFAVRAAFAKADLYQGILTGQDRRLNLIPDVSGQDTDLKWTISAPAGNRITEIDRQGETVIPNGRILTPTGKTVEVAPHPYGLALSPDGSMAVTANNGIRPISVSILRDIISDNPSVSQIPKGYSTDDGVLAAVYMGIAISPDNHKLYVAGGQEGKIFIFDLATEQPLGVIDCNTIIDGTKFTSSYIGDMVMDRRGNRLFAVDQLNFRLLIIDAEKQQILQSVPVGRYPFGVCLSPDEKKAYVANVGMYEYEIAYTYQPNDPQEKRIGDHLYGYLTKESAEGISNDTMTVPGLGDPLSAESFSVFSVDLTSKPRAEVTAKIKTGILVGEVLDDIPAVGGSSPNSVVATEDYVFVSNGNNDCITVIDAESDTISQQLFLTPDSRLGNLRGMIPYGVAVSPDQKRLFVAESGINAVGVIDIPSLTVIGHIPVGWFPSKLKVSPDGKKLVVANAKGYGSGPNGGPDFDLGPRGSYIGNLMNGTVSIFDIPPDEDLPVLTRKVLANNFVFEPVDQPSEEYRRESPVPLYPGQKESPIKHIVFIAKENRTYDEVFGQLAAGNGEPSMARYGTGVDILASSGDTLRDLVIAPNHLALAQQFTVCDNFYVDSDVSVDGQRWLLGMYPNEWTETNVVNQYGGVRSFNRDTTAPGMAILAAGLVPEEYNEAGSMWDHFERNQVNFFNFGLDLRITPYQAKAGYAPDYNRVVVNKPVPTGLLKNSSKLYPSYNMSIPDQFRADMFIQEFDSRWGEGKEQMPSFTTIRLPNDHGAGIRPDAGYPYRESYMMDNDLALGRIIDYLSHTEYWENMLIVVTEDDAQGGRDHIDAHRSVCLVISPYTQRGHISPVHYSFGSIMKTFWNILDVPYLNQFDAGATDMADCFTKTPNTRPYEVRAVDPQIFNPDLALDPFDREFDWSALEDSPAIDDVKVMQEVSAEEDRERRAGKPFAPIIEPLESRFLDRLNITLKNVVFEAEIRYTLDGSDPDRNSTQYEGPFEIDRTTVLKAKSFGKNGAFSLTAQKTFQKLSWMTPERVSNLAPGLKYAYFEGNWLQVPEMSRLKPNKTGIASGVDLSAFQARPDHWAGYLEGYINMEQDGIYTFYLRSDDGAVLYIGGNEVVNNDGSHSAQTKTGKVALRKGMHKLRLEYFEDYDSEALSVSFASDSMPKQILPHSVLFHVP